LSAIFIIFNHDTETVVIKPIKKVVQIIIKLAENPLKKPAVPTEEEETGH
jgi:dUTPase